MKTYRIKQGKHVDIRGVRYTDEVEVSDADAERLRRQGIIGDVESKGPAKAPEDRREELRALYDQGSDILEADDYRDAVSFLAAMGEMPDSRKKDAVMSKLRAVVYGGE